VAGGETQALMACKIGGSPESRVGKRQMHFERRMKRREFGQQRSDPPPAKLHRRANPQGAPVVAPRPDTSASASRRVFEDGPTMLIIERALVGQTERRALRSAGLEQKSCLNVEARLFIASKALAGC
jgi:hypothetical protein